MLWKFWEVLLAGQIKATGFWVFGTVMEFHSSNMKHGTQQSPLHHISTFIYFFRLQQAIKLKWLGKLSQKILLMHDDAQLYTVALIKALLRNLKQEAWYYLSSYRSVFELVRLRLVFHWLLYNVYWDLNIKFQMLVALRVITTSEWSRSKLL